MEEEKQPIETVGLVQVEPPLLPPDSYDVTFVNFSDDTYEYIRRYTTLLDPVDVTNGIIDKLLVNSGTASTNTSTGALIVNGGVGIGSSVYIAGITSITNTTPSTNKDNGALVVDGGVGIEQNLNVGGDSTIAGVTTITNATNAVNKDTGALVVEGGVGIEKDLYVGGAFITGSNLSVGSTTESIDKDTGALIIEGGVGIEKNLNAGGSFTILGIGTINNSTSSISTTTGAFQVKGGVGVGENLNVGGSSTILGIGTINNSTSSISTTTGAFQVKGGVGVGENLNVGNNLYVAGVSTFVGNVDFLGGTSGTITIGDVVGTDNVVFNADVNSNLIPNITNTYDLGNTLQQWRNVYLQTAYVSNSVGFADGSVTLPSITFTNDLDTGLWRPGTNEIAVSTGGAQRVRIDSLGNVKIGDATATQGGKVTIQGPGAAGQWNALTISGETTVNLTSKGGMISASRYNNANIPFHLLSGWDDSVSRYLDIGGGGWGTQSPTITKVWVDTSYASAVNTAQSVVEFKKAGLETDAQVTIPSYEVSYFGSSATYAAAMPVISVRPIQGGDYNNEYAALSFYNDWSEYGPGDIRTYRESMIGGAPDGGTGSLKNPDYIRLNTTRPDRNGERWRFSCEMDGGFRSSIENYPTLANGTNYRNAGMWPAYFCRVWVRTDSDTGIYASSSNITSVSEPTIYRKQIDFLAMPDANYATCVTAHTTGSGGGNNQLYGTIVSQTTTSVLAQFSDDASLNIPGETTWIIVR